jgi:hypothetical protein
VNIVRLAGLHQRYRPLYRCHHSVLAEDSRFPDSGFSPEKQDPLISDPGRGPFSAERAHNVCAANKEMLLGGPLAEFGKPLTNAPPQRPWRDSQVRVLLTDLLQVLVDHS